MQELEKELGWSPPSLYLFHKAQEPWILRQKGIDASSIEDSITQSIEIAELFGKSTNASYCYYLEFKPADSDEFSRSILLAD